ncbi:transposase [Streptomyces sp. NPDC102437]|uniref:transposase n=1 Tax=Streptomyces sp. NPDC102437 TaxID=3366175 RepID=UPI0038197F41
MPEVDVLGIGETRRGKPRWEEDLDTGRRAEHAIGGTPASSTPSGRAGCWARSMTAASPRCWLATTSLAWRKSITHVAIDVSATYRAAIRTGLPHTRVVIDRFHVVRHALGGPAPHHCRGPRPTRTSHRSGVVGPPAPAAQP